MMFRSTSTHLDEPDRSIRECPVGMILRETPYVYEAIGAAAHVENGALNPLNESPWLQGAIRVVSSERERHRRLRDELSKSRADSRAGIGVRHGHR